MASPKRSKFERERDLSIIADLYRRAQTQQGIADHLNKLYYSDRPITQQQVGYDIKIMVGRWRKSAEQSIDERKAIELARIDLLEREYWDAWERSRRNAETVTIRRKRPASIMDSPDDATLEIEYDEDGNPVEELLDEREYKITGQVGDARYLAGVQWCITKRCEILGINAPVKLQHSGKNGGPLEVKAYVNVSPDDWDEPTETGE